MHITLIKNFFFTSFTAGSNSSHRGKLLAIFQTTAEVLCRIYGGDSKIYIE